MNIFCLFIYFLELFSIPSLIHGTVVVSSKPGLENEGSGAQLSHDPKVHLVDFTLCWRFYEFRNPDSRYLISSMSKHKNGKYTHIFRCYSKLIHEKDTNWVEFHGYQMQVNVTWSPMQWNHVCFSYTNSTSNARMVSNGDIILDETMEKLKQNPEEIPDEFIGNFGIMRKYFPRPKFHSVVGRMTDVNIWNISMKTEDMKHWTKCINNESGNICIFVYSD